MCVSRGRRAVSLSSLVAADTPPAFWASLDAAKHEKPTLLCVYRHLASVAVQRCTHDPPVDCDCGSVERDKNKYESPVLLLPYDVAFMANRATNPNPAWPARRGLSSRTASFVGRFITVFDPRQGYRHVWEDPVTKFDYTTYWSKVGFRRWTGPSVPEHQPFLNCVLCLTNF